MNRETYLKLIAGGKANKRKPKPTRVRPESSLAKLQRERPEMFSGSYFYAVVKDWKSMRHVPTAWDSKGFVTSKATTAAREEALASNDAQRRWAALGNLGELAKVRR